MVSRRRYRRIMFELEAINARLDDLVGLITSQMPDDAFPCDAPDIEMIPAAMLGDRPPPRHCDGCGIPLPPSAPFNRCGYCNL